MKTSIEWKIIRKGRERKVAILEMKFACAFCGAKETFHFPLDMVELNLDNPQVDETG